MPFSKENRMSTILILAIVITTLIGVMTIAGVANNATTTSSTPAITSIIGFVGIAVNQLLGILKSELARRDAKQESKDIQLSLRQVKTEAETAKNVAVETKESLDVKLKDIATHVGESAVKVVQIAVEAQKSQMLDAIALPKTPQELEKLIEKVVLRVCGACGESKLKRQ